MTALKRTTILLTAIGGLMMATTPANAQQGNDSSTTCTWTFSKGSGAARISYCVNLHGNIMSFSTPQGFEHIRVGPFSGAGLTDGYGVCSGPPFTQDEILHGYDFGDLGKSAWGDAEVVSGPTEGGVVVRRTTADGILEITHAFKLDATEDDVTVTATIKNLSSSALSHVDYTRLSDFDASGQMTNLWTRTDDEVSAISRANKHGISLNALSFTIPHTIAIGVFTSNFHAETHHCDGFFANGTDSDGDHYARLVYHLGTLNALAKKTVKFVYKRQ